MKVTCLEPGDRIIAVMPYSEVCMHMQIAGKTMQVELLPGGWCAQLYDMEGKHYSFPITTGEAGLYHDGEKTWGYAVAPE